MYDPYTGQDPTTDPEEQRANDLPANAVGANYDAGPEASGGPYYTNPDAGGGGSAGSAPITPDIGSGGGGGGSSLPGYLGAAGTGAGIGATIGSVVPGIGTGIGAAVGAGGGLVASLLGSIFGGGPSDEEKVNLERSKLALELSKRQEAARSYLLDHFLRDPRVIAATRAQEQLHDVGQPNAAGAAFDQLRGVRRG